MFQGVWRFVLRLFSPFRQMSFRTAVKYTFASVVTVVLLEAALLGAAGYYEFGSDGDTHRLRDEALSQGQALAGQIGVRPMTDAIIGRKLDADLAESNSRILSPINFVLGQDMTAAILDDQGHVLSCAPGIPYRIGEALTTQVPPETAILVRNALNDPLIGSGYGGRSETGVYYSGARYGESSNMGVLVGAAPIAAGGSQSRGLLVLICTRRPIASGYVRMSLTIIGVTIPFVFVIAGLCGLIFGYDTMRPLRRRVAAFSLAAEAWGKGDFTVLAPEWPDDELGKLARRLNAMTNSLRAHIRAQQRIATLEERNRLARDLHDTVKQQAFAAAMQLGAARTVLAGDAGPAGIFIAQAEKLTNKIQEDLMTIIQELKPDLPGAAAQTLGERLRDDALDWVNTSGIEAVVQADPALTAPPPVSQALLRIAQEALSNVARHSQATRVDIALEQPSPAALTLTIGDNGLGFDPDGVQRGMGLSSMRDRALSLPEGRFSLETQPSAGVRIRVSCQSGGPDAGIK